MERISAVYKIVNTVTGDCYVGSSKNIKERWRAHKNPTVWGRHPNSQLYKEMHKYGVDKFRFQILCPVEPKHLKEVEQELIDSIKPMYNKNRANGHDIQRYKEKRKEYLRTDKYKEWKASYEINNKEKLKENKRAYRETEKGKECNRKQARKDMKKYINQLCFYNGETLTLNALASRFRRAGLAHPIVEAKKYLLNK